VDSGSGADEEEHAMRARDTTNNVKKYIFYFENIK